MYIYSQFGKMKFLYFFMKFNLTRDILKRELGIKHKINKHYFHRTTTVKTSDFISSTPFDYIEIIYDFNYEKKS